MIFHCKIFCFFFFWIFLRVIWFFLRINVFGEILCMTVFRLDFLENGKICMYVSLWNSRQSFTFVKICFNCEIFFFLSLTFWAGKLVQKFQSVFLVFFFACLAKFFSTVTGNVIWMSFQELRFNFLFTWSLMKDKKKGKMKFNYSFVGLQGSSSPMSCK